MRQSGLGDVEPTQTDGRTAAVFSDTRSSQRKCSLVRQLKFKFLNNVRRFFKQL